jgi:hypothetical protein
MSEKAVHNTTWEKVNKNTWRMQVPGGWLVKTNTSGSWGNGINWGSVSHSVSICFYPDIGHMWQLNEEDKEEADA